MTTGWQTPRCSSTGMRECNLAWAHDSCTQARGRSQGVEEALHANTRVPSSRVHLHDCCPCHPWRREAWHRPSVGGFVETMRRLRWGEVGFASLRTWGTLGNNYWWAPREAGCPAEQHGAYAPQLRCQT